MKKEFVYFLKFILSVGVLLFAQKYFFWFLEIIGIHNDNLSSQMTSLLYTILYFIILIIVFIIYKEEIKSSFNKYKHKAPSNLIHCLMAFTITLVAVIISNYIAKAIGSSFHLNYDEINYINIFNRTLDFSLILVILKSVIFIPIIYVSIFVLGVNNIFDNTFGIIMSGILYVTFTTYLSNYTTTGNILINALPQFILYVILGYIYRKNNNIAFSIITYILYILFAGLIVNRFV